jgi:hypothetical protein
VFKKRGVEKLEKEKVKVKKMSLCLTKYHAMKTNWGVEVQLHAFLTLALDEKTRIKTYEVSRISDGFITNTIKT